LQVKKLSENSSLSFAIRNLLLLKILVHSLVTVLPTTLLALNLAEKDDYVLCAGEINRNCYTAGVSDWKGHTSYFQIHLDHAKCFERETPRCDFPIQQHINAVVQEFSKHLEAHDPSKEL